MRRLFFLHHFQRVNQRIYKVELHWLLTKFILYYFFFFDGLRILYIQKCLYVISGSPPVTLNLVIPSLISALKSSLRFSMLKISFFLKNYYF